ncbi:energy transducer TonB [Novosphingobium guangzhouense]|uniref:TonB C-terminal domain-containing protein n=1 Tax=Novosphingobium guangzhouense TaxID=1850347 RepID=A0A2K2FTP6_9SPHN|nr:TonB family protein [Novosphingobium guangzhouense]PNU02159.1 hypothetical protein A8V01_09790 [Novosphingobium guangzhouense]
MVGFAKSLRLSEERSSGRGALRLPALAITGVVHLLVIALFVWCGGRPHPAGAPRDAMHLVLLPPTSSTPVERRAKPARAAEQPIATKSKASPPIPATAPSAAGLQQATALLPDPDVPDVTIAQTATQVPHRSQDEIATDYRQVLFESLAAQRHYPEAARLQHYQGQGAVMFRIDRDGRLLEASMEKSTGKRILDRAALMQVRRAAPFPEIPGELPDELIVSMSLQFLITQPGRQMAAR